MKRSVRDIASITATKLNPNNVSQMAKTIWVELQKQKKFDELDRFIALIDEIKAEKEGKLAAEVISATPLTESSQSQIIKKLESKYSKPVLVTFRVKSDLLGGLKIKIEDEILDLSWRGKLEKIKSMAEAHHE